MDTKKRIIRLEQGANAYMQRSIASGGALAILYGRYSKHYIKKSEVFPLISLSNKPVYRLINCKSPCAVISFINEISVYLSLKNKKEKEKKERKKNQLINH